MASYSNTSILIKRSTATGTPGTLKAGELAYSYLSNTIFIGNSTGTGVVNVGGQYYTSQIDNATSLNTPSTIVKRDPGGNISVGYITANGISVTGLIANSANSLSQTQYFGAYGDATAANVAFNGTANVELEISLATVNSNIGTYGNTTTIPSITVDAKGRITSISNSTISTSFTVTGNTGSGSQSGGGTLTLEGNGTGITTTVTGSGGNETVLFGTDNTVLRTNTSSIGPQTIGTDVSISGNLIVSGTATYVNTSIVQTNDSMIELAANNTTGDVIDIGFYGLYNNGSTNNITGLLRDAGSKNYYLFANIAATNASIANTLSNNYFTQANTATLYTNVNGFQGTFGTANITNATVGTLSLTNALAVGQGGTGATSFTAGSIVVGNGTGALQVLANTGTAGTYANAAYVPVITTDAYGRVSNITNTAIAISASQVTSGTLAIAQGGTNSSSFNSNQITYYNGTAIVSLANTGTAGTYGAINYIPIITTDGFGRVSSVSNTAIGGLSVSQGGTGAATFGSGQILIGNGTGAISSLANTSFSNTGIAAANSTITSLSVDAYGRTTAAIYTAIAGLTVGQGGTGQSSFTSQGIVYGNGTSGLSVTAAASTSDQTWSNQILTVNNSGVPTWTTTMDGGTF